MIHGPHGVLNPIQNNLVMLQMKMLMDTPAIEGIMMGKQYIIDGLCPIQPMALEEV